MATWAEVVDFSRPLVDTAGDKIVTFTPMTALPMIVFDRQAGHRRVVPMRWGFPHRSNPNLPDPIHVRAETIDEKPTYREAFLAGQRGIVVVRTFNEGKDVGSRTEQHTVAPGDGKPLGIAFLWRRFDLADHPIPLLACVMATVPANALIGEITDRMPAVLAMDDWAKWLGEMPSSPQDVKAVLKTVEGVAWTMKMEEPPPRPPKATRTPDQHELF